MAKCVRSSILLPLILIASAAIASAGPLTVNLNRYCDSPPFCPFDVGVEGSPAWGSADFFLGPIAPFWTISFQTGDAISWWETDQSYSATFGHGGWFSMTGPEGLTFSGEVTGGTGFIQANEYDDLDVTFFGQWSNGLYGGGNTYFVASFPFWNISEVSLQTYVAPEPSSLGLMVAGVAGIWSLRERYRQKMKRSS